MNDRLPRRLAAVWFADISGFSRRAAVDEDEALHLVQLFQAVCRDVVDRLDGRIVKFLGDGAMAEFGSCDAAVRAACMARAAFRARAETAGIEDADVHLGVHLGEIATGRDGDIYGEGVNVASRLQDLAATGQVVVSEDVQGTLHQQRDFSFEDLGEQTVKGRARPIRVYAVEIDEQSLARHPDTGRSGRPLLLDELVRRRIPHAAALYGLGVALLAVLATTVFPGLPLPPASGRVLVVLSILAFPLVIAASWMYDITPGGIRRTPPPPGETPGLRRKRLIWLGAGTVLAVTVAAMSARYLPGPTSPLAPLMAGEETDEIHADRLAVMYFDDFSPEGRLGHLVDGLTEALIQELDDIPDLEVVSRNGVRPFRDAVAPVDSVARILGAGTLVQGSVSESGDRLRVSVQLIDGTTGTVLDSDTVERAHRELFELQDELARSVAGFLRRRLGEEVRLRRMQAEKRNVEAWELVQLAEQIKQEALPLYDPDNPSGVESQLDRADTLLARAASLDPGWSEPPVRRAGLALERALWRREPERWIQTGLGHATRALVLRPNDPEGLEVRGTLRLVRYIFGLEDDAARAERLLEAAETDLRAATEVDPGNALAYARLSTLLAVRGATVESYLAAKRAYESDVWQEDAENAVWNLFTSSYDANRPEEAARWCRELDRRFTERGRHLECRIWLMTMPGAEPDPEEAWATYATYGKLAKPEAYSDAVTRMAVAAVLARAGLPDSAIAVAERARLGETEDAAGDLAYFEAFVRTIAGDRAGALRGLEESLDTPSRRKEAAETWFFEDLRDDPEFQRLVGAGS